MEHQETLKTGALVSEFPDPVENKVNKLFADGVVTSGVVVGSIFLASNQLFGVEQLPIGTSADLIWKKNHNLNLERN